MKHRNVRIRQLAVMAIGAITAVSATAVFGVGAASAATLGQVTSVTAVSTLNVHPGAANQPVGNLTFSVANDFASLDTLTLNLPACQTATDYIAFSATPTVTVTGGSSTETAPTITPTLAEQSGEGAACVAAGVKDQLVLTFGNSASSTGTTAWTVTLSGLKYNLGAGFTTTTGVAGAATTGAIPMTGSYLASATGSTSQPVTVASNAALADYAVTANTPGVAVAPTASDAAISNLVITEYTPGVVKVGTVSVTLSAGTFAASSTPTATASGGGAVVGTTPVAGMGTATLTFQVTTASSTGPATYTLSGLAVATSGATAGPVTVSVSDNGNTTPTLASAVKVFAVINAASPIYGQTAVDTSAALFEKNGCRSTAVLATSDNFPDALSASYLASALGTSVIVTPTAAVAQATLNALRVEGVAHVFVVGGPLAISAADVSTLESTPSYHCGGYLETTTLIGTVTNLTVTRIYGQTQYGTAERVAEYVSSAPGTVGVPGAYGGTYNDTTGNNGTAAANAPTSAVPTAILAVGTNYPDAMAASAMAYANGLPVLLTQTASLAPEAEAAIVNLGIQQVIVMGGPLAISNNVVTQLMGLGVSTFRIAGIDATDTAQLLAQFELNTTNASSVPDGLGWTPAKGLVVTRGDYYTDALSASAFAGSNETPIVLTENPTTVGQYLTSFLNTAGTTGYSGKTVYGYQVIGGPLAIAPATMTTISNALAVNPS
jgi:putative cell wall-binding protein